MTWTLGIAIAGLVISCITFIMTIEALDRSGSRHDYKHDKISDTFTKHDFRLIRLEKKNKALRKAMKDD